MGGPSRASRWGLLLRMEEVLVGVEETGGVEEGLEWGRTERSCMGAAGAGNGAGSNSPPNSMSWLLMSWSISVKTCKQSNGFLQAFKRSSQGMHELNQMYCQKGYDVCLTGP